MELRKLDEKEKKFVEKQVVRLQGEFEHYEWLEEYNDLMLDKGLRMNYEEKVREFKQIRSEIKVSLKEKRVVIDKLKEQLEKGVEVKERPSGVG